MKKVLKLMNQPGKNTLKPGLLFNQKTKRSGIDFLLSTIILIIFSSCFLSAGEIKKPVLKTGIHSKNSFYKLEEKKIYPGLFYDYFYLTFQETFHSCFSFQH